MGLANKRFNVNGAYLGIFLVIITGLLFISFFGGSAYQLDGVSNKNNPNSADDAKLEIQTAVKGAGYDDVIVVAAKHGTTVKGTVPSEADKINVRQLSERNSFFIPVKNDLTVRNTPAAIQPKVVTEVEQPNSNYDVVRIFYATDRKVSATDPLLTTYGPERDDDGALALGTVDVSIPKNHITGGMERPSKGILRSEEREDPKSTLCY